MEEAMKKQSQILLYHIIFPMTLTLLFFLNAALPRTTLGCANRGLVAIVLAFTCILAALFTAIMALKKRISNESESIWWIISTLILVIPVIALLLLV
jgi:hypothetical protein